MDGGCVIVLRLLWVVFLVGFSGHLRGAWAQAPLEASQGLVQPTFEVVSIHAMRPDDTRAEHIDNPLRSGYVRAVNVSLKSLMEIAFDIPDLRIFGGPSWLSSERFSLEAKADPRVDELLASATREQAKQAKQTMIAGMLTKRFKLAVHTEMKEMPVYAMVIAKGGPKLDGARSNDGSPSSGDELLEIRKGNDSLQILAYELSWRVGRPVLDRTGLQDKEALTLRWRGDEEAQGDSNAPSLFLALQEQLGLRLEPTRSPVPILLVDHAEKPTGDQ